MGIMDQVDDSVIMSPALAKWPTDGTADPQTNCHGKMLGDVFADLIRSVAIAPIAILLSRIVNFFSLRTWPITSLVVILSTILSHRRKVGKLVAYAMTESWGHTL